MDSLSPEFWSGFGAGLFAVIPIACWAWLCAEVVAPRLFDWLFRGSK